MASLGETELLAGAELWAVGPPERPAAVFVAGWEDADPFCAAVCTNDVGLAFCRRCPAAVVGRALADARPARDRCPAGVGLIAFPVPRGERGQVGVLRLDRPTPAQATAIARTVRVAPATLRRAARVAAAPAGRAVLGAARTLRATGGLSGWRAATREAAAMRRRSTNAALAQMIVTGEEYHELYRTSQRHIRELEQSCRLLDVFARDSTRQREMARAAIAHRIHDSAAQSLVGAFRHLEAAQAFAPDEPRLREQLLLASERLSLAIAETRAVMGDLMPPGLEELGLTPAIDMHGRRLAAEQAAQGIAPGEISVEGHLPRLTPWVEQALYGVTSEAITNAVRHGRAPHISVRLRIRGSRGVIEIDDDGRGFDPAAAARTAGEGHLGLLGITRQTRWLGGTAVVRSSPGHGTHIRVSLPLQRHLAGVGQNDEMGPTA